MKLMYPPTKTNILNLKRTDLLFYKQPSTENYKVFNQTKGIIGEFTVEKRNEMFINNLFVTPNNRRNNLGTQILNFIKILSKQNGLGGKMRVLSSLLGNETKNPPHIFYRKYGFTSDDKKALTEIDKHIKNKHQLPSSFKPMFMYYIPPKV